MSFYRFARGLVRIYLRIFNKWRIEGLENVPDSGAAVLIANHVSYADPVILDCTMKRKIYYMAKAELFSNKLIRKLLTSLGGFPVKRGKIDRTALRTAAKYLEDGELLGIFPEGTRHKPGEMGEFMPGASIFALRAGAPIIPIALIGSRRIFFGNITVRIGQPLVYPEYYGGKIGEEVLNKVTEDCHQQVQRLLCNTSG